MSDLQGKIINQRYQVERFIDAGGMSLVYRVWDRKMNAPLAMKVLRSDLLDDPNALERFQREGRALRALAHPHIVPFYGIERYQDLVFLLEQYIDGATLKQILARQPEQRMAPLEALVYLKAVCSALGYAHANGVVHCDIKPGNVMVDRVGKIYLTDFGIARHAESTTTTLAGAGSPSYMAPEQIKGLAVSAATDVYALGVMLFEMLTGRRPFTGSEQTGGAEQTGGSSSNATGADRVRSAHLLLPPPDPRTINPAIPEGLARAILCAMAKTPEARYASAMDFFHALCAVLDVSPAQIPDHVAAPQINLPPDAPEDEPNHSRFHAPVWAWIGGIVAVCALLGGFAAFGAPMIGAYLATDTPIPSATLVPTDAPPQTPLPTYTEQPTFTPPPTQTPRPTYTSPPPPTHTPRPRPTDTPEPPTPVPSYYFLVSNSASNPIMSCRVNGSYWGDLYPGAAAKFEIPLNTSVILKCCPKDSLKRCVSRSFTFNTPGMTISLQ